MSNKYVQNAVYRDVEAIRYRGDMNSLRELVSFTGLPPDDIYHMSIDWGIVCAITTKNGGKVRLDPGEYLVKFEDELFAVPSSCFEKFYMRKDDEG